MVTRAVVSGNRVAVNKTQSTAKPAIVQRDTSKLIQRAQADPTSLSSAEIFHLQGKLGNQAIMRLLDTNAPQAIIQRNGSLLGGGAVASDEYEGDEGEAEDADYVAKKTKLEEIATQLKTYYDMHSNYKKYEKFMSGPGWRAFKTVWEYGNKIIGWVSKVDPTGITKIITSVSKALKTIAAVFEEGVKLGTDAALRQEVTPLLSHDMTLQTVKDAIAEVVTVKNAVKTLVEAIV